MAQLILYPSIFDANAIRMRVDEQTLQGCINQILMVRPDLVGLLSHARFGIQLSGFNIDGDLAEWKDLPVHESDVLILRVVPGGGVDLTAILIAMAVSMAISMAINFILVMAFPGEEVGGQSWINSPSYGWSNVPVMTEGDPIPLIFGTMRVAPAIMSAYIENEVTYDRTYQTEGANTWTLSNEAHSDYQSSFTATKAGTNDGITGVVVPISLSVDPTKGAEVGLISQSYLPTEFRYKTKTPAQAWGDVEWVTTVVRYGYLTIDELAYEDAWDILIEAVKYADTYLYVEGSYSDYEKLFEADYKTSDFITYDDIKTKCRSLSTKGDKQYLNLLLGWGEGPIKGVHNDGLMVNDQQISNYDDNDASNGVEVVMNHRAGTVDQTAIDGFDLATESVVGAFPYDLSVISATATVDMPSGAEASGITLGFKCIIFGINDKGNMIERYLTYKIETQVYGTGTWTDQGTRTITGRDAGHAYRSIRIGGLAPGRYSVRLTKVTDSVFDADKESAVFYWQYMNIHSPYGYTYPGIALTGVRLLATDKLSGMPSIYGIVDGLLVTVPKVQISGVTAQFAACWWDDYDEVYRHMGDSSTTPDTACDALGGNTEIQWSPNPFWIYYEILTNSAWGHGDKIAAAQVDDTEILAAGKWADELVSVDTDTGETEITTGTTFGGSTATVSGAGWTTDEHAGKWIRIDSGSYSGQIRRCASNTADTISLHAAWSDIPSSGDDITIVSNMRKRCEFHGTMDEAKKLIDWVKALLFCARAHPACIGSLYTVIVDREKSVTGLLNMGNIGADSWSEAMYFTPPTHFRARFLDATNGWQHAEHEIISDGYEIGDEINVVQYNYVGITSVDRIVRELSYIKNKSAYCSRTMSAKMLLDNIHALPGDLVKVSHDAPIWGWSGRIKGAGTDVTGGYLTVDTPVTLVSGKSYNVALRIDDAVEVHAIDEASTGYSATTTLYITDTWSTTPDAFTDLWILENDTDSVEGKLFIVQEIRRKNDNTAEVLLLEYNESVYDDNPVMPTQIVSGLIGMIPPAPNAVSVSMSWVLKGAEWIPHIDIAVELDPASRWANAPGTKCRLRAHLEDGDTTGDGLVITSFETTWNVGGMTYRLDASEFHDKTAYVTACMISQKGVIGPVMASPTVFYIDTAFAPTMVPSVMVDTSKGDSGYDYYDSHYSIYLKWWNISGPEVTPPGWQLSGGKYAPVTWWNSGNNWYVFDQYWLIFAVVSGDGVYPAFDEMNFVAQGDIGNIFDTNGDLIADADTLDSICKNAAAKRIDNIPYGDTWVAWTVGASLKDGRAAVDADATDWGLDWDWLQVPVPGGANTVENTALSAIELSYTLSAGLYSMCELFWSYTLESPAIDGFAILWRSQPYWWAWDLDASWTSSSTDKPSLDTTSQGGSASWTNLLTIMAGWKAKGITYCYFMVSDASNYEVVRVDLASTVIAGTWVIARAQEGTTAISWSSGAILSFACSEYTDQWLWIDDTNKRQISFAPIPIRQALHVSMAAVKAVSASPGYKRSPLAFISTLTQN